MFKKGMFKKSASKEGKDGSHTDTHGHDDVIGPDHPHHKGGEGYHTIEHKESGHMHHISHHEDGIHHSVSHPEHGVHHLIHNHGENSALAAPSGGGEKGEGYQVDDSENFQGQVK